MHKAEELRIMHREYERKKQTMNKTELQLPARDAPRPKNEQTLASYLQ